MTAGELVQELSQWPKDKPVLIYVGEKGWYMNVVSCAEGQDDEPAFLIEATDDYDPRQW